MKIAYFLLTSILLLSSCDSVTKEERKTNYGIDPSAIKVDVIAPEHGMADPHAWVENDSVYVICGHDESWDGIGSFRMDRWEVWSTGDLANWKHHRNIYPKDTYIGDSPNCWAGDVCERDGKYYWFFSNRNINTGVVVADEITGEYKDLLGKPLLPKDIIPGHPYDPEIFIENNVYTICFGAGTYYMATLAKDMKSLTTKPQKIIVQDEKGNSLKVEDKPTLFKRNDWYYLVYGSRYSMSRNLYGPYTFKGAFLDGGHTSFFEWKDQLYVLQENHDISAFYRGASLKPVFFNKDETIIVPKYDKMYPAPGRPFEFKNSTMGWKALNGTDLLFKNGKIRGDISAKNATVQSAPWLFTNTEECSHFTISIKNKSNAKQLKLALFSRDLEKGFWKETDPVKWEQQQWVSIPISSNDKEFKTYTIQLSQFNKLKERLMQIAMQPVSDANNGTWEIEEMHIE